jgi:AcrR family transcriptional regulator
MSLKQTSSAPEPAPKTRPRGRPPGISEQGVETRERILRVATELFAEKGYHGTGVAEIGERAGIRRGALYYHIDSKEELLFEVMCPHIREVLKEAERIAAADLDPAEKLHRLMIHHVRIIAERRSEVVIFFRDFDALTGDRAAELQDLRNRVEQAWRRVLEEGVAEGLFVSGDRITVAGILGLVNWVYLWYRPSGELTPEQIADRFLELLLRGLLTDRGRRRGRRKAA